MEGTDVNVDELDYLARRLGSFAYTGAKPPRAWIKSATLPENPANKGLCQL